MTREELIKKFEYSIFAYNDFDNDEIFLRKLVNIVDEYEFSKFGLPQPPNMNLEELQSVILDTLNNIANTTWGTASADMYVTHILNSVNNYIKTLEQFDDEDDIISNVDSLLVIGETFEQTYRRVENIAITFGVVCTYTFNDIVLEVRTATTYEQIKDYYTTELFNKHNILK